MRLPYYETFYPGKKWNRKVGWEDSGSTIQICPLCQHALRLGKWLNKKSHALNNPTFIYCPHCKETKETND